MLAFGAMNNFSANSDSSAYSDDDVHRARVDTESARQPGHRGLSGIYATWSLEVYLETVKFVERSVFEEDRAPYQWDDTWTHDF
jgi:hypothetical protein